MRRLSLAAVCGTLILAACSDQSPTEPTPPPQPEQSLASCRPAHHFPIVQVSALIVKVFPKGKLQIEALARAAATALLWETCKTPLAQRSAIEFVNFMNANSSKLIGTQTQRNTLISLVLNGVDIPFTTPPGGTGDFGVGFFDPGKTTNTVVTTLNGTALVELEPGSFNQPTSIVISRKSDGFTLTNFDGDQFPPYFDYDAINAAGDHVLKNGKTAIVAFCLLDPVYTYPENPRIGHNPVAGAPGFPFEVLEEVNLADHPGLAAQLHCGNLNPNTIIIGGFGPGLPGLANAAWRNTRYYLGPVAETLFLPEALYAATMGTLPPPAGRAPSLSPFGVVDVEESARFLDFNEPNGDPSGKTFGQGATLTWQVCSKGCSGPLYPSVVVTSGEEPVEGVVVTVSLHTEGEGAFGEGSDLTETTNSYGVAVFDDLSIPDEGTYQLSFSAPGASEPVISENFTVSPLTLRFDGNGDPSERTFVTNQGFSWNCGIENSCFPTVVLEDSEENPVGGIEVTVTLASDEGPVDFEGATAVTNDGVFNPDEKGKATFFSIHTSNTGFYQLHFSAPGAADLSRTINVVDPPPIE